MKILKKTVSNMKIAPGRRCCEKHGPFCPSDGTPGSIAQVVNTSLRESITVDNWKDSKTTIQTLNEASK